MLDTAWPAWPQGLSSRHGSSIVRGLIQSLGERFPGPQATLLQVFEEIADRLSLAVPQQRFSRARTLHPRTTTASSPARRLSRTPGGPHRITTLPTTTLAKSKPKSRDFLNTALPPWPAGLSMSWALSTSWGPVQRAHSYTESVCFPCTPKPSRLADLTVTSYCVMSSRRSRSRSPPRRRRWACVFMVCGVRF